MKKEKIFLLGIIFLIFLSCGIEEPVQIEYLASPSDLKAYPKNGKIKLKFYSQNNEERFDGFNVYISRSSYLKGQSLSPVKNPQTGGIPTIVMNTKVDPNIPIEVIINYDDKDNPIENGITYYLIVKAHSFRNYESQPSNEVSTTPRIESIEQIILYENEGFNLNSQMKTPPYNFVFSVSNQKAYLTALNNTMILSKGYYQNWEEVNKADLYGYLQSNRPLPVNEGYVILYKTPDNHYAKIWIKEINISSQSYIKFLWAFQQIAGNNDI